MVAGYNFDELFLITINWFIIGYIIYTFQWFGNIVTNDWWDDLWLNEGFASYVEYLGVDYVHPDWQKVSLI